MLGFVNATLSTNMQRSLQYTDFVSFGYVPRSGMAGYDGNNSLFNNDYRNLYFHQQCEGYPCFHILARTYCLFVLFCFVFSNRCEVISPWGFNLWFLIISGDKHIFICLLAIFMYSFEKWLFHCSFLNQLIWFLLSTHLNS